MAETTESVELARAKNIVKSRTLVINDGAYEVRCTNVTPYEGKYIANFAAMTQYHKEQLAEGVKAFKESGDMDALTKGLNSALSANLRPTDYIPAKGEFVKIQVGTVTTNNGVTGQFILAVSPIKSIQATTVDLSDVF